MKQYSGWQAWFLSFWSPALYQDVARQWHGIGYVYLFLLVCLTCFFVSLQIQIVVVPLTEQIADGIAGQLPHGTIARGVLSIDKPSPYVILEPKSSKPLFTFDTRATPATVSDANGAFVVTDRAILVKRRMPEGYTSRSEGADDGDIQRYPLDNLDCTFDAASAKQMANGLLQWMGVLMFLFGVPINFIRCLLQTLIYALIGMIFCSIFKVKLSYPTLIRLSAVALTPVLLLDSLQNVATVHMGYWWFVSIVLALGYLCFAVWSNKSEVSPSPDATA